MELRTGTAGLSLSLALSRSLSLSLSPSLSLSRSLTASCSLREIVSTKDGKGYRLGSLTEVKTLANADGTLDIPGVKIRSQTGEDPSVTVRVSTAISALEKQSEDGQKQGGGENDNAQGKRNGKKKLDAGRDSAADAPVKTTQPHAPVFAARSSARTQRRRDREHTRFGSASQLGRGRVLGDAVVGSHGCAATWPKALRGLDSDSDSDEGINSDADGYGYGGGSGSSRGRWSDTAVGGGRQGEGWVRQRGYSREGAGHAAQSPSHRVSRLTGVGAGGSYRSFPRHSVAGFRAVRCSQESSDEVEGKPSTNEVMRPSLTERAERSGIPIVGCTDRRLLKSRYPARTHSHSLIAYRMFG